MEDISKQSNETKFEIPITLNYEKKFTFDDPASYEDLKNWSDRKIITKMNNPSKFISKKVLNAIQNNNLNEGSIYETWFKNPVIEEENHFMANGYANGWIINTIALCSGDKEKNCFKNNDGTYEVELILEFWPQKLFYIGSAISAIALFFCVVYISYDIIKNYPSKFKKY